MMRPLVLTLAALVAMSQLPAIAQEQAHRRVPPVQDDTRDPDALATFKDLRARGTEPLNLHRIYANAARISRRMSALAQALRNDAVVPRADRELIILRATQLAHGDYPHEEHKPIAMSCGITATQIDALAQWQASALFSERQRAVLAYADAMVAPNGVDDSTFEGMKRFFTVQEIVELTFNAAYYSATSQISRALGVTTEGNPEKTNYGKC
jgi:alkylhydroperoxidase family enzyme